MSKIENSVFQLHQTRLYSYIGLALYGVLCGSPAHAQTPSVSDKTFTLTGSYTPKVAVKCKVGGAHSAKQQRELNLPASVTFAADGTFKWSDSGFSLGVFNNDSPGTWSQNGGKIEMSFDADQYSAVKALSEMMGQSAAALGGGATVSGTTTKYSFVAKINSKGVLQVTETGGFKFTASASAGGASNSCNFAFNLTRQYSGTEQ